MSRRWEWEHVGGLTEGKVYIRSGDESHPGWCCSEGDIAELMREIEPLASIINPPPSPAGFVRILRNRINELARRVGLLEGQTARGGEAESLRARAAELEAEVERKAQVIRDQDENIKSIDDQLGQADERNDELHTELVVARCRLSELETYIGSERGELLAVIGNLYRKSLWVYRADGSHALLDNEADVAKFRVEAAGKLAAAGD